MISRDTLGERVSYGVEADYWSLGCLTYALIPPPAPAVARPPRTRHSPTRGADEGAPPHDDVERMALRWGLGHLNQSEPTRSRRPAARHGVENSCVHAQPR